MLCPECSIEMIVLESRHVEIDYCHECGGIWLDDGELELLLGELSSQTEKITAFWDLISASEKQSSDSTGRPCPVCRKKMTCFRAKGDLELDKCPSGHGIWFDRDELRALSHALSGDPIAGFIGDLFPSSAGKCESK